jgi:hypothetical protein
LLFSPGEVFGCFYFSAHFFIDIYPKRIYRLKKQLICFNLCPVSFL